MWRRFLEKQASTADPATHSRYCAGLGAGAASFLDPVVALHHE